MEFQTHSCARCGTRFQASCLSELEEKIRRHNCPKTNKRVARTEELKQNIMKRAVHDTVDNRIKQHNFERLVEQGMIVSI